MEIHMFKKRLKFVGALLTITYLYLLVCPFLYSETETTFPQKGICYATWEKNRLASRYSDRSLEKLASIGVEYISIVVTQYQDKYNSLFIKRTDKTPTDKSVVHAIKKAHKLGMKVMLKPHIDLIDKLDGTYWRADIGSTREEDWEKWFKEYRGFIVHYARMAKRHKVEIFCIGTELAFASRKDEFWRERIIPAVRKVYPGKLVYAANWDNYKNIKFWKDLDYAGIDAYFPLTYEPDPSMEELRKGWEKWKNEIGAWQAGINRPVIFTEIGYASTKSAPTAPWKNGMEGNADPEMQAKCYKAFFETVWNSSWLAGVYWWRWSPSTHSGGKNNRHFTPQNKPAEKILEANYKDFMGAGSYAILGQ